ncbi:MAG: GFA family protein [Deltaproteobacteria bacterium]|nr:GFA family protein [Deltaproteobacteria bacterium]
MSDDALIAHEGGCHCRCVRFSVLAPAEIHVEACNCSMCRRLGFLHLIVPRSRFRLLTGADALRTYSFNTGTAKHLFCERCGVESFYVPRSHPDGYSVNARCLEPGTVAAVHVRDFDGQHWEQSIHQLPPLRS